MKIAICGGGVAGLSTYLWLRKLGLTEQHDVQIYEQRKGSGKNGPADKASGRLRSIGGSLSLAPNGLRVLRRLDITLHDEVVRTGALNTTFRLSNEYGWTMVIFRNLTNVLIGRDDMWQCLRNQVPDEVVSTKQLRSLQVNDAESPLMLVFADGSKTNADLVVGADGVRSVVRTSMIARMTETSDRYLPQYQGLINVSCFVPPGILTDVPEGRINLINARKGAIAYALDRGPSHPEGARGVSWATFPMEHLPEDWRQVDAKVVGSEVKDRYCDVQDAVLQKCLASFQSQAFWPGFTIPELPSWEDGSGTILVGDAAHALNISSGQGVSMALEDAEALAKLLKYHLAKNPGNGHLVACKQFHGFRKQRVMEVAEYGQANAHKKRDGTVIGQIFLFIVVRILALFGVLDRNMRELWNYDVAKEIEWLFTMQEATEKQGIEGFAVELKH